MPSEQWEASVPAPTSFLGTALPILLGILCIYFTARVFSVSGNKVKVEVNAVKAPTKSRSEIGVKSFTVEEVAQHGSREDCWIIVDKEVYDVTSYVDEHPGGDAILNNAGRDSSEGFHGPQHPSRVLDHIKDYYIGELKQ